MERRITGSQAVTDGAEIAIALTVDDGSTVMWLMDLRVIESARRQIDRCEKALQSPTQPAQ